MIGKMLLKTKIQLQKAKTNNNMNYFYTSIRIVILGLLITNLASCSQNEGTEETETASKKTERNLDKDNNSGLVIAYYVQDSIATGFKFYREVDSMLKSKEKDFERQLRAKYDNYAQYENKIRQRMEAGEITGYQLDDIQQEAMRKQEAIANFERQRGAELQQESFNYQNALMNKISEAGKAFSEKNDIDILLFYQKGGQVTYISDAFDVTADFIAFLNDREEEIISDVEDEIEAGDKKSDGSLGLGL